MMRSFIKLSARRSFRNSISVRRLSGSSSGHGHHEHHRGHDEPHAPAFHTYFGKVLLITTYLWIMYRIKEDKGQLFGLYQPWLDEHEHGLTVNFIEGEDGDSMPLVDEEEEDHSSRSEETEDEES